MTAPGIEASEILPHADRVLAACRSEFVTANAAGPWIPHVEVSSCIRRRVRPYNFSSLSKKER